MDCVIENNICDEPESTSSSNNCNTLDSWITNIFTTSTPNKEFEQIRDNTPSDTKCLSTSSFTSSTVVYE